MPSSAPQVFINGRFLTQKITGVQRFAHEIVQALDRLLVEQEAAPMVTLIAPEGTPAPYKLSHIRFLPFGARRGHLWEQTDLLSAARGGFLINLGPSGPILKRNQITIIHDAAVYRSPKNYSFLYGTMHRIIERILARTSRIGTVSGFSRSELSEVLHLRENDIAVIPDGYDHILSIAPQDEILDRLNLHERPYFLFVGSTTPNKNLARAISSFVSLNRQDVSFVIVGGSEKSVYQGTLSEKPANVLMPGRLTDGEVVSLYGKACALVFPSLYEGFGIPPLEAMALKCPVIASRIPPVVEVCSDAALYFDPMNEADITRRMKDIIGSEELRAGLIEKGIRRLPLFSWCNSARKLLSAILH